MPLLNNLQSLGYFLPEIALIAGVLLILSWDLVIRRSTGLLGVVVLTIASLLTDAVIAASYLFKMLPAKHLFHGLLAFDTYAHLFHVFFAAVAIVVVVFALPGKETGADSPKRKGAAEFFALLLVVVLGLNLMVMSRNLLMIYLSLEIVSVISFVLAGFQIRDKRSSEGALKYVIFGGTASGIMLYGMSWLYGISQSLDLAEIGERISLETARQGHIPLVVVLAVTAVLVGFGYKISAAPFHMWTPDVYEGAPISITAFLSVGPKAAGFAIAVRFFAEGLQAKAVEFESLTPWTVLAGVLAMLTMIIGNFTALHQSNVKRMLAYSSIAHAGYMLLGFCLFDSDGVRAIIFYVFVYALMNLGAFLVVAAVAERSNGSEQIEAFHGLGKRAPVLALTMAIFLFSLAGLPPFAGFIGKFYIFAALVRAGGSWNWVLASVGVINSVVSLFYYARILRAMYLTAPEEKASEPLISRLSWKTATILLAIPTVALGIYWAPVYHLVTLAVR